MNRLIPDTNVLLRLYLKDDIAQLELVRDLLDGPERIRIARLPLTEFLWVLLKGKNRQPRADVLSFVASLAGHPNVDVDEPIEPVLDLIGRGADPGDAILTADRGQDVIVTFDQGCARLDSTTRLLGR